MNEITQREAEVLRLVALGLTNEQVGNVLGISWRTVKAHLYSAYRKLGARNRTHAVVLATFPELVEVAS
jgi:DNA-binding CsgD family transcriptional regulator